MRFQIAHIFCLLGAAEAIAIGSPEKEYVVAFPSTYIGYCNPLT